jgi:tripartite-type tricarboxylate transporter receptor subunit TctC
MKARTFCLVAAILSAIASAGHAQTKDYPRKPIQIVVAHAAGSAVDIFYRLYAEEMSRALKVPVNLVNKPTASGSVAANEVAHAPKDGYTLLAALVGQQTTLSIANPKNPTNILRDFDPIEVHTYAANTLFTKADSQFKSLEDVIDQARKKPGEIILGLSEMGSNSHLESSQFIRLAKVDVTQVFNEGPPQIITGVLGGHYHLGWGNHVNITPLVASGKVRALATDIKSPLGVPTFTEKGYPVYLPLLMGLFAPKGTPATVLKAWEEATNAAMRDEKFQASINKLTFIVTMTTGPDKLDKLLKEEYARYSKFTPEELGWKGK